MCTIVIAQSFLEWNKPGKEAPKEIRDTWPRAKFFFEEFILKDEELRRIKMLLQ